jgi:glycosyltransferase involved in cell wall biosynthesis
LGEIDLLDIPALINCMDLILLPSKNEGLPLIALESIACGTPIIGSRVCGIPETIGLENTVELNEMFIEKFSTLAIDVLSNKRDVKLNPMFDWSKTAEIEGQFYDKYR